MTEAQVGESDRSLCAAHHGAWTVHPHLGQTKMRSRSIRLVQLVGGCQIPGEVRSRLCVSDLFEVNR